MCKTRIALCLLLGVCCCDAVWSPLKLSTNKAAQLLERDDADAVPCEDESLRAEPWKKAELDLKKQIDALDLTKLKKDIEDCQKEKEELSTDIKKREEEVKDVIEKRDDCQKRKKELSDKIKAKEVEKKDKETERDGIAAEIDKLKEKKNQLLESLRAEKKKLREAEEARDLAEEDFNRCEADRLKKEDQKKKLLQDKNAVIDLNGRLKAELHQKEEDYQKCVNSKNKLVKDCADRQASLRKQIDALMPLPNRFELQDQIDECEDTITTIKNKAYFCRESPFQISQDADDEKEAKHICGYKLIACKSQLDRYKKAKMIDCDGADDGKLECRRHRVGPPSFTTSTPFTTAPIITIPPPPVKGGATSMERSDLSKANSSFDEVSKWLTA